MFSNLNFTKKGMILVLVPVVFEILFVSCFWLLFMTAFADYEKVEARKDMLVLAERHTAVTVRVMLDMWQKLTTKGPEQDEILAQSMDHFAKVMDNNHTERLMERMHEPPELRELIDEAEGVGLSAQKIAIKVAFWVRKYGLQTAKREMVYKEKVQFMTLIYQLEDVNRRITEAERAVRQREPEQQKELRQIATAVLVVFIIIGCAVSILLMIYFTKDIRQRLQLVSENAFYLASAKPLKEPQAGSDEIAELDRVLHESEVILSEARRKELAVLDNAGDVICSLDSKLRIVAIGAAAQKMWLYSADELLGRSVLTLISQNSVDKTREFFHGFAESKEEGVFENVILCKDGSTKTSQWTVRWSKQERSYFCVVHDVTELRAVEKLKQNFLSMVSHDLRAPLSAVGVSLAILTTEKRGPLPAKTMEQLGKVESNMSRLMALINELLELEKLEAGKLALELAPVSSQDICDTAREALESLADKFNVRIQLSQNDYMVSAEERRLVQVMINLLSNAIKFSPAGSTVTVDVSAADNFAEFRVEDQGPGIAAENIDLIFDKFSQAGTESETGIKSSGLGLAIVKAIVEAHGGKVGVTSAPGKGSSFWFKVPLSSEGGAPA